MEAIAIILFGILLVLMFICVMFASVANALMDIRSVLKKWKEDA